MSSATLEARLLKALPDALVAVDQDLRVTFWSPAAEQLYGWAAAEAVGHRIGLLLTKNLFFHERTFAPLRALRGSEAWRGELRLRHRSGREIDVHVTASLLPDDTASPGAGEGTEGEAAPSGFVLLHRPIAQSAPVSSKQPSKASIAQSGVLFHNSNDIVVILDGGGRIVAWNPAAERVGKWRSSEVLNRPFDEFVQPINDLSGLRTALSQSGGWRGEMTIYDRMGEEVLLDSDVTAVRDATGNLLGVVTISRDITHTRRSEAARRRSDARLRALLSIIPDTFVRVDREGNVQDMVANGPFRTLLGGADVTGRNLRELFPDVASGLLAAIEQASSERRIVHLTHHADDQLRPAGGRDAAVAMGEIRDLSFRVVAAAEEALIIVQDITELTRIERELRESEERYRHLVEQKQVGVYVIQDERFVYVNPRFAELVGYDRDELLQLPNCLDLVTDVDRELARHNLGRRLQGETLAPYPLRLRYRDGRVVHGEIYASVTSFQGRQAVLGTIVDVTQRRLAEQALRDSEERYRTLVGALQEGVMLLSPEGRVITCNDSALRILGVTAEELIASTDGKMDLGFSYVDDEGQPLHRTELPPKITLDTGMGMTGVVVGMRPRDGVLRWLSINTRVLPREEGKPSPGIVVSMIDVTQRRRSEEELQRQAFYDALTGLANRALFLDRVERALSQARRTDQLVAVGYLDLDFFKQLNDTRGHAMGDHVLKQIATRLCRCLREGDTIGRMGGDEFTLLLPMVTSPTEAARVAERVLDVIRQPVVLEGHQYTITASLGLSLFPTHADTPTELLRMADIALYRAKGQGRNSYQVFDPSVTDQTMGAAAMRLYASSSRPPRRS